MNKWKIKVNWRIANRERYRNLWR